MTETKIMKALECCAEQKPCRECPLFSYSQDADKCKNKLFVNALALINRKNAEIELLENESKRQATKAIKEVFQAIDFMCIDTFGNFNHKAFINLKKETGVEL